METSRSAKRVILFLIGLNVATILTAVTIFSSGMFVANANQAQSCTLSNATTFTLEGSYTGKLFNTQKQLQANIKLTLNGTSKKITSAKFSAVGQAGSKQAIDLKKGTLIKANTRDITSFSIQATDNSGANVVLHFIGVGLSAKSMSGTYSIDTTGLYKGTEGKWTISAP